MPNNSLSGLLSAIINNPKYPTKEKILNKPLKHKREIIEAVKLWKKEYWKEAKTANPREKFETLKLLLDNIAFTYDKPVNVEFIPEITSCCYNPRTQTIAINNTTSIISALHEMAHHLFGASELKACRWSIWLFKKTFPIAYSKLIWNKHMLIKPTSICPTHQIGFPSDSTTSSE